MDKLDFDQLERTVQSLQNQVKLLTLNLKNLREEQKAVNLVWDRQYKDWKPSEVTQLQNAFSQFLEERAKWHRRSPSAVLSKLRKLYEFVVIRDRR